MGRKRAAWICALLIVAAYLPASPARAASISVTTTTDEFGSGAKCSLREAVQAANQDAAFGGCSAGSGTDTIQLKAGTYQLTLEGDDDLNTTGDLDVLSPAKIIGAQRDATIVQGLGGDPPGDRIFYAAVGVSLELQGLTVRGGRSSGFGDGGGILLDNGGTLELTDVKVAANEAGFEGGGIHAYSGDITLRRTLVIGNSAGDNGGGVNHDGSGELTIIDSVIRNNHADDFNGGGIAAESNVVLDLRRSRVIGNIAGSNGAGIYASSNSPVTIVDSTIADNRAGDVGGGVRAVFDVELTRTTINNNHAGANAGGMYAIASLVMTNSTISSNTSNNFGGGLFLTPNPETAAELRSSTIVRNVADADDSGTGDGGGIHVEGDVIIANMLIADNSDPGGEAPDCSGTLTSEGHNLIGLDSSCGTFLESDLVGTGPRIPPRLGPLEMNGGYTETHSLLPGSIVIGAGNPGTPGGNHPACPASDQRGAPREDCDIGAYQLVTCFGRAVNVVGTSGNDNFKGTNEAEVYLTLDGNDTVNGGGGFDAACGGDGNDKLKGGGDPDKLSGGNGTDTLNGGPANDVCVGGAGQDSATACEKRQSI